MRIETKIRRIFRGAFDELGIEKFAVEWGGKHPALVFQHSGRRHRLSVPATPSDHRSYLNNIATLKRYVRNINAVT